MWNQTVEIMASWKGRFAYTNDTRRKWPLYYGAGDCSSVINAAYHQHDPSLYKRLDGTKEAPLGERSFNMATNPRLITVAQGTSARGVALDALLAKLRPGDIICMGWKTGYYHSSGISHVELYAGNGMCWGHGGPGKGPTMNRQGLGYWLANSRVFTVKRVPAPAPTQAPKQATPAKKRKKRMNTGIYYQRGKTTNVAIVNTTSGFFQEYSVTNGGTYNNQIAQGFDTGSFVKVTESHYKAISRACEQVRAGKHINLTVKPEEKK